MDSNNVNLSKSRLDIKRMQEVSGIGTNYRTKVHVVLRHVITYSDGSEKEIDSVSIIKPIASVFKHAGYVNVRLDFNSAQDLDLKYFWQMLENYSDPSNSVSYLPDELLSGVYNDGEGDKMVYFPVIQLSLIPIGKETEYNLIGFNPLFYTLQPRDPQTGIPSVIQFTFDEQWFITTDKLDAIDKGELYKEVYELMKEEESLRY